jgi:ribosome-associated toxin RatA of RatAB toxin-antitoxin module
MTRVSLTHLKPWIVITVAFALMLAMHLPAFGDMLAEVKAGKIVVHSIPAKKGPDTGRAIGMIEAPTNVVVDILSRLDRYKDFVPRIVGSRKVKKNKYVIESDLPWPVKSAWVYVGVTRKDSGRTAYLRWRMLNGTFEAYEGMAWVQPIDAKRSLLTYQMLAVPKTSAPDSMISKGLRSATERMIKAIRKEAAKVMAQRSVKGPRVAAQ